MESYGTSNMGCTASTERSEDDMQRRRLHEDNELVLNPSSQPPSIPWSAPVTNSSLQHGHPTPNTQTQNPGSGSNFLAQNRPLGPILAPVPGTQHLPRPSFPQGNQQYLDPWDARGSETFYRFEHFPNRDIRRHGLDDLQQTPAPRGAKGIRGTVNASKKKTTMTKACSICLGQFSGQDSVRTNFPYSCERFCGQVICITCLKDWFIDACKNESKMPPRCCCTVPLSAVSHLLSEDQIDLYKSKFEEWRTPDRFYCPVPTCSTFIPPRLMKEGPPQSKIEQTSPGYLSVPTVHYPPKSNMHKGPLQPQNENFNPGKEQTSSSKYLSVPAIHYPAKASIHNGTLQSQNENLNPGEKQTPLPPSLLAQQFTKKDVEVKLTASVSPITIAFSTIICPKCTVSICTRCRLLQHPDAPCPQTDLDPLLSTQLEKWKIKRCPKCRAGVRRMFGCSHIECRCGAHFCFSCLQPMKKCDGRCEDSDFDDDFDDEDDMSDDEFDSEDIDALMAMDGTPLDLGVEPYNPTVDTWDCNHSFKPIYKFAGILSNGRILNYQNQINRPLDCQVCWKVLTPHLPPANALKINTNIEGLSPWSGLSPGPDWAPTTVDGEPAWTCVGKHLVCYGCPKDTMLDSKTSKYSCECNAFCLKCAKVVEGDNMQSANEGENKDINLAYDCKCGMIVCGACKVKLEDEMKES